MDDGGRIGDRRPGYLHLPRAPMSREICNQCLAKQALDRPLSAAERRKLVHRWRFDFGSAEHFRRDCRWWPKDGSRFHQRGIDLREHVEAGSSHVAVLWSIVSAVLVSMWAPFLLFAQSTTVTIDVALILTAMTPLIVAVAAAFQVITARRAKAAVAEVHTLVNDQMTREKENRLLEMRVNRVTLSRLAQDKALPDDQALLTDLDKRIAALQQEITARDAIAGTLPSAAPPRTRR